VGADADIPHPGNIKTHTKRTSLEKIIVPRANPLNVFQYTGII
jgi:hypothetical protein